MMIFHFCSNKNICRNWITKLDNNTLYFYGFLKRTLLNNGATMKRDNLKVVNKKCKISINTTLQPSVKILSEHLHFYGCLILLQFEACLFTKVT